MGAAVKRIVGVGALLRAQREAGLANTVSRSVRTTFVEAKQKVQLTGLERLDLRDCPAAESLPQSVRQALEANGTRQGEGCEIEL